MKTVTFTDFRKQASGLITAVEQGETLILLRHGRPVAEIIPFTQRQDSLPSWKQPGIKLAIKGATLSSAILDEREEQ